MLTKINYDRTWSCKGINFEDLNGNAYGALCKLRDYEKSGFEPDDLDRIRENSCYKFLFRHSVSKKQGGKFR